MAFSSLPGVTITELVPPLTTLEDLKARYEGCAMTPERLGVMRQDALRLGVRRVYIARDLGTVHLGKMGAGAFRQMVGRKPEQDDLHRVNCLDAGTVGHLMCGWCDKHGSPCFECACLALS